MPPEPDISDGQLVDVRLTHIEFARNADFDFDFDDLTFGVERSVSAETGDEISTIALEIRINWHTTEDKAPPFDLFVRLEGVFEWSEERERTPDEIGWLRFNGPYLLWPYARSHMTSITAASGLPPLMLPTLVVPTLSWDADGEAVDEAGVESHETR